MDKNTKVSTAVLFRLAGMSPIYCFAETLVKRPRKSPSYEDFWREGFPERQFSRS